MRTTFTNDHVQRDDNTCNGSCPWGQTHKEHEQDSGFSADSAKSNDSLARGSSVASDEVLQIQSIQLTSRPGKLTMSVSEAADWLGISRAFAYELVARGEIPSIRLGRRVLVPAKRLLDFVSAD